MTSTVFYISIFSRISCFSVERPTVAHGIKLNYYIQIDGIAFYYGLYIVAMFIKFVILKLSKHNLMCL